MFIEVRGVQFINKGAELMLHAIVEQMSSRFSEAKFVMESRDSHRVAAARGLCIFTKLQPEKLKEPLRTFLPLLPEFLLNKMAIVKEQQISVVLDGSGFAFGDFWGARKAELRMANQIADWKQQGKTVILLPQAFGPFTEERLRNKMILILGLADLIYARDEISFQHLMALDVGCEKIFLSPDFTGLIDGILPEYFDHKLHQVAVIPNSKMIEATEPDVRHAYPVFLRKAIKLIRERGFSPFFLIHEGSADVKLAEEINRGLDSRLPVIIEENPLKIKGIIGASRAVISSRFHGLVSSLAQGVPCLATGWSHKYEMLLKDYHCPALLCQVTETESLEYKLQSILDEKASSNLSNMLMKYSRIEKQKALKMWTKVEEVIKSAASK